jgi:DNA-directed RNA polymerase specialized sigma subunit
MSMYFGPQVDEKIAEYHSEPDIDKRNKIFEEHIRPAMLKLIESQMYLYGFYKIDDPDTLKNECLATLYETLPKFDPSKGKKAFSYFNVVVKNWFIWKIRDKNKKLKQQSENFYGIDHDRVKNDPSIVLQSYEDEVIEREFWVELHRDMDKWRGSLKKDQERRVLDAIVFLLQNPHLVSIFNKKAVFLYIKEMTGLTTKQVNLNMNRLKMLYAAFRERFHSGEEG